MTTRTSVTIKWEKFALADSWTVAEAKAKLSEVIEQAGQVARKDRAQRPKGRRRGVGRGVGTQDGVITWLEQVDEDRVFLSVSTLAELRHEIERLGAGAHRKRLGRWLRESCHCASRRESSP